MGKQQGAVTTGRSITQLTAPLHKTVENLKQHVLDNRNPLEIGVTGWKDAVDMTIDGRDDIDEIPECEGKMFLGRSEGL